MRATLVLTLSVALFAATAHACLHSPFRPVWPMVADYELAEQARTRPLTAAEVTRIGGNWLTTFVYLEAALQASLLRGQGSAYLDLPTPPAGGCINTTLQQLLALARDGELSEADLASLWPESTALAYDAYMIATDGGQSRYLLSQASRPKSAALVSRYYRLRNAEPVELAERVDYWIERTVMLAGVGTARMLEIGDAARDVLWQHVQALRQPLPTDRDIVAVAKRRALVEDALFVLGAVNDLRVHSFPDSELPLLLPSERLYLQTLRNRNPGVRDLRHERLVFFWQALGCGSGGGPVSLRSRL